MENFPINLSWQVMSVMGVALPTFFVAILAWYYPWRYLLKKWFSIDVQEISLWTITLVAAIAARLGYIILNFEHYRVDWSALWNIRDGGWWAWAAALAAIVFCLVVYRQQQRWTVLSWVLSVGFIYLFLQWGQQSTLPTIPHHLSWKNAQGESMTMQSLVQQAKQQKKAVVINIWATWCPPCRREMPAFAAVQKARSDVDIIFLNIGESLSVVENFLQSQNLVLENIWWDDVQQTVRHFNIRGYPSSILIDATGAVQRIHMGEFSEASLNSAIDQL